MFVKKRKRNALIRIDGLRLVIQRGGGGGWHISGITSSLVNGWAYIQLYPGGLKTGGGFNVGFYSMLSLQSYN